MEVKEYSTPQAFLQDAKDFLYNKETENALILGIVLSDPSKWDKMSMFTVSKDGKIVFAAFQTCFSGTFFPLGLTNTTEPEAADELFKYMHETGGHFDSVKDVVGPIIPVERFVQRFNAVFPDKPFKLHKKERTHKLVTVNPEYLKSGPEKLIAAQSSNMDMVVDWYIKFMNDVDLASEINEAGIKKRVTLDETPVSMAMVTRETDNVGSISLVYTPPDHRNKGYASKTVAQLAKHIQDVRKRKYKKIGFDAELDVNMYKRPV